LAGIAGSFIPGVGAATKLASGLLGGGGGSQGYIAPAYQSGGSGFGPTPSIYGGFVP
jgi:hypothetical protein